MSWGSDTREPYDVAESWLDSQEPLLPQGQRGGVALPHVVLRDARLQAVTVQRQYSPLMTKKLPRIVPASFDFCVADLNREASSWGTSIVSESLNPTARFDPSTAYMTLIDRPLS